MRNLAVGDHVQTPFGKGVVREVRNHGRLLVEVHGRALVVKDSDVASVDAAAPKTRRASVRPQTTSTGDVRSVPRQPDEVDLHGLTVDEALARVDAALNDALLADRTELRLIHGRSGGRIRAALHRRLAGIPTVRAFALDPHNDGVTIVRL